MKPIKAIFIIIAPLMIIACVVTHLYSRRTIRETYYYIQDIYKDENIVFFDNIKALTNNIKNLDYSLPNVDERNAGILDYLKWFGRVIVNILTILKLPIDYVLNLGYFLLQTFSYFIRSVFFLLGFEG